MLMAPNMRSCSSLLTKMVSLLLILKVVVFIVVDPYLIFNFCTWRPLSGLTISILTAGQLFLIKGAYSSLEQHKYHVISTTLLGADTRVTKMLLRGSGTDAHIFIGTENGIYRVPTADCARFTDCCSCVAARDPYCTYDLTSHKCLAVGSTDSDRENLLQDFAQGNSSLCFAAAMSMDSMSPAPSANGKGCSTGVATTAVDMTTGINTDQATTTLPYITGM